MKHLPVNLATAPVENVRRVRRWLRGVAATAAAVTLMHGLLVAWLSWPSQPTDGRAMTIRSTEVDAWQAEVEDLKQVADVSRGRAAAAAVEIGNAVISWRAIPWDDIFNDLEGLLPDRVRLELVQPAVEGGGDVRVSMVAAADDPARLQDLLLSLEAEPAFTEIYPTREERGPDGLYRMTLGARYLLSQNTAGGGSGGSR